MTKMMNIPPANTIYPIALEDTPHEYFSTMERACHSHYCHIDEISYSAGNKYNYITVWST